MATQRPQLDVVANPTNNFVAPIDAAKLGGVLDQQAIQRTYQFADAFSELSVTAAKFAATLKTEQNKENMESGIALVNQSRKSYSKLVSSGEIRPSENPWFAVGAQEASGTIEAQASSIELKKLIEQQQYENPAFLEDTKGFDALVADYASRKGAEFAGDKYRAASFFANFNPSVVKLQSDNLEAVENKRFEKFLQAADAKVRLAVDSLDPRSVSGRVEDVQKALDEAVLNSGGRGGEINQAYAAALINIMKSDPELVDEAEVIFKSLKTNTGNLADTSVSKNLMMKYASEIGATRLSTTSNESRLILDKQVNLIRAYESGNFGFGDEAHQEVLDAFDAYADPLSGFITINAAKTDSEREYLYRKLQATDASIAAARDQLAAETIRLDAKALADAKNFRDQLQSKLRLNLRDQIEGGELTPEAAANTFKDYISKPDLSYPPSELLDYSKAAEEDFKTRGTAFVEGQVKKATAGVEAKVSEGAIRQVQDFIYASVKDPSQPSRPIDAVKIRQDADLMLADVRLPDGNVMNQEQRNKALERTYTASVSRTRSALTAVYTKSVANGGLAPQDFTTLAPEQSDTEQIRKTKESFRFVINDALVSLDEAFGQKDNVAYFLRIADTQITPENITVGMSPEVIDFWNIWKQSQSGALRSNIFGSPAGSRLAQVFQKADVMVSAGKVSLQDALLDALNGQAVTSGSPINDWTTLGNPSQSDKEQFDGNIKYIVSKTGITHPDALLLLSSIYGSEVISNFGSGADMLNLSRALSKSVDSTREKIVIMNGSFLIKEGAIGARGFNETHFIDLAKFYAPSAENPVFVPIRKTAQGSFIYALRDASGSTVVDRIFSLEDLASPEALMRSTYRNKTGGNEQNYMAEKGLDFVDYSATFEARNKRMGRLVRPTGGQP